MLNTPIPLLILVYATIYPVFLSKKPHPQNPERNSRLVILSFSWYHSKSRQNNFWHSIFENHKIISPLKPKLSKSNFDLSTNTFAICKPLKLGFRAELSRQPSTKPCQHTSLKHIELCSAPLCTRHRRKRT